MSVAMAMASQKKKSGGTLKQPPGWGQERVVEEG